MKLERGKINILYDNMSYGSAAKGLVCAKIAQVTLPEVLLSSHGVSSSHTVSTPEDEFVFKILPSASFMRREVPNYDPVVFLPPSCSFSIEQLKKEVEYVGLPFNRVIIHPRAVVVTEEHGKAESKHTRHLGGTSSGQAMAVAEKILRTPGIKLAKDYPELGNYGVVPEDSYEWIQALQEMLEEGALALAELPQGLPLSLDYSIEYPFNTYRNVNPMQFMSDVGLNHSYLGKIIGNQRVYPIRVSNRYKNDSMEHVTIKIKDDDKEYKPEELGMNYDDVNAITYAVEYLNTPTVPFGFDFTVEKINGVEGTSGPFDPDLEEVSWRRISDMMGEDTSEITTLTKLGRRIAIPKNGIMSISLYLKGLTTVKPDYLSFTFLNYLEPSVAGVTTEDEILQGKVKEWYSNLLYMLNLSSEDSPKVIALQAGKYIDNVIMMQG